jgi:xylan 1,4-beta-xylosidase
MKKSKYIFTFLLTFAVALVFPYSAHASDLTIDFSQTIGPAQRRATGFEWLYFPNMNAMRPFITQLKPNIIKDPRTEGLGLSPDNFGTARFQDIIGLEYALFNSSFDGVWPYKDYTKWQTFVQNKVTTLTANGTKYDWAIWQEPDQELGMPGDYIDKAVWSGTRDQFFETWKVAVQAVRQLRPNDKIVGPSLKRFRPDYLQSFLLYAKGNNVLPDILSWNQVGTYIGENGQTPNDIPPQVATIRQFMQSNGIPNIPIEITEYGMFKSEYQPGYAVAYITNIEQSQIEGSIGQWGWSGVGGVVGGEGGDFPRLSGLITDPNAPQPRSVWWVYKSYADMTGNIVKTTAATVINGLGSYDTATNTAKVLIGNQAGVIGSKTITLKGLPQALQGNGNVLAKIEHIPNTESNPLYVPNGVSVILLPFSNGNVAVTVPNVGTLDAAVITITKPPTISANVSSNQINVSFNNSIALTNDWIGIFKPGDAVNAYLDWKWLNNAQGAAPSSPVTNGSVTLTLPAAGNYEVRYINAGSVLATTNVSVGSTAKIGDLNGDGKVDFYDYNIFVPDYGKTGAPGFVVSDIDKNGKVDIFDYNILVGNYGK